MGPRHFDVDAFVSEYDERNFNPLDEQEIEITEDGEWEDEYDDEYDLDEREVNDGYGY